MAENDDPLETVVYECQQAAKQLGELFHKNRTVAEVERKRRSTPPLSARSAVPGQWVRTGAWPMKCVTSSAVRPYTTGALSASAQSRCFPPTPAMPGCWILPSGWPFDWRAMAIPIQSTSMRPTPTSPSPGPGITTSTVQLSYTATESPIGFSPSLATPQTRSVNCADRENFKYFWLVLVAYRE